MAMFDCQMVTSDVPFDPYGSAGFIITRCFFLENGDTPTHGHFNGKMIAGSRALFVGTMLVDFGPLGDRLGVAVLHTFDAVPSQRTALPWTYDPNPPPLDYHCLVC
jgi:hypothetical protein